LLSKRNEEVQELLSLKCIEQWIVVLLSGILSWFSFGGNLSVSVYLAYISIRLHDIDMLVML